MAGEWTVKSLQKVAQTTAHPFLEGYCMHEIIKHCGTITAVWRVILIDCSLSCGMGNLFAYTRHCFMH